MSGIRYILNGKEVSREEWLGDARQRKERFRRMVEAGRPPAARTDREFLEGHCNGNQFETTPHLGDSYAEVARAHGQDTTGKVYLSQLARFPGDPEAWVSGRGDVTRVLESRGWGATGAVNTPLRLEEPAPTVGVAEDILQQEVADILQTVPPEERAMVDTEDLREQVLEKRKPYWVE